MPTVQQRTEQNAFAVSYRVGAPPAPGTYCAPGLPRAHPPTTTPARPVPAARPKSRQQMQTAWLLVMVCAAFASVVVGLAYIYGYALVTKEGYRRAQLKSALRQEREMAQQLKQELALTHTPLIIDRKARSIGMVRANDQQTVTVEDNSLSQPSHIAGY